MPHPLGAAALAAAQALYLFAPLLVSAALAGLVQRFDWLHALRRPIDCGATLRERRLFGDSKTWRGVVIAVVGSIGTVAAQRALRAEVPASLQVLDYGHARSVWLGSAIGAGAMLGELPNSFVKRRLGLASGSTTTGWPAAVFYLWDQLDLLTGAWPLLLVWLRPSALLVAMSLVVALALHPLVALIGYIVGARTSAR